jgi:hypothetical protein
VTLLQSAEPHVQSQELEDELSTIEHGGEELHLSLLPMSQYKPTVAALHSFLEFPQTQDAVFAALPSEFVQVGIVLHLFRVSVQKSPFVMFRQLDEPQTQFPVFEFRPFVLTHLVYKRHVLCEAWQYALYILVLPYKQVDSPQWQGPILATNPF